MTEVASPYIMEAMNGPGSPPLDVAAVWDEFASQLRGWFVRRVAQPADAEDLVQHVFLRLAEKPPAGAERDRIGAWLWRVARNVLVDHYRRREVRRMDALEADVAAKEDAAGISDLARCLGPMLRGLPAPYADAVREADLEGRRQADLAREAGIGLSAMKSRVQRGRKMLQALLQQCCGVYRDAQTGRVVGLVEGVDCSTCDDGSDCSEA